jgi:hypothetical protein
VKCHLKHGKINHPKDVPRALVELQTFRVAPLPRLQRVLEDGGTKLA